MPGAYVVLDGFEAVAPWPGFDAGNLCRIDGSLRVERDISFCFVVLCGLVDEDGIGGAGGGSACLRLRENHEVEVEGALDVDVVEVTEDFRDNPMMGILLLSFSFSFSTPLADLEP